MRVCERERKLDPTECFIKVLKIINSINSNKYHNDENEQHDKAKTKLKT